jgi:hypothetical protein
LAYTWLRERESGERMKASDEGAGMVESMCAWLGEPGKAIGEYGGGGWYGWK